MSKAMVQACEDAMAKPFINLIIDLQPNTRDMLRFRSIVLSDKGDPFWQVQLEYLYDL